MNWLEEHWPKFLFIFIVVLMMIGIRQLLYDIKSANAQDNAGDQIDPVICRTEFPGTASNKMFVITIEHDGHQYIIAQYLGDISLIHSPTCSCNGKLRTAQ